MNEAWHKVVVPVEFEDGTRMYMEAVQDDKTSDGSRRVLASAGGDLTGKFQTLTDAVRNIAKQIKDAVVVAAPNETTVEFGLDVKIEPGGIAALVVRGDATASIKVTLKWAKEPKADT